MQGLQGSAGTQEEYEKNDMKVLQGNLNRCRAADSLIEQLVLEIDAHIAIISEQYRNKDSQHWYADLTGTAAIWVVDTQMVSVSRSGCGNGYVWITGKKGTFVSCYLSPNEGIQKYQEKLNKMEDAMADFRGDLVIAGDFNARAAEWGMPHMDRRGKLLLEMAARLGLVVVNKGSKPTYCRPGFGFSIPDVTLVSESLATRTESWQVLRDYTGSDHKYISFVVEERKKNIIYKGGHQTAWNVGKIDKDLLVEAVAFGAYCNQTRYPVPARVDTAEAIVDTVSRIIRQACELAMPRRRLNRKRQQAYWWTNEIAELRLKCLQLRRKAQRARGKPDAANLSTQHMTAKKCLRTAIRLSKERCWKTLRDELNDDPWGMGYKLVARKFGGASSNTRMNAGMVMRVVDALFPNHPRMNKRETQAGNEIPLFTTSELSEAVASLKSGRAPGPDGVPAEVMKIVASAQPHLLLNMYNACLKAGTFASPWKVARLVLINKGKGSPDSPSSYRPLCMLNTAGKVMEKLIKARLQKAILAAGGLSDQQHGFREGHSTISAIQQVVTTVQAADERCHAARPIVLLVTLDVRNAFNSLRWEHVMEALERTFSVPEYILAVMRDYLNNRWLKCETSEGWWTKEVTSGAAQGSILGPDLWNIAYDSLLRLEMPDDVKVVGYADDVAAVITARNVESAQLRLNQVMRRIIAWMEGHGLSLAIPKTEIVLLTRKRIATLMTMMVGPEHINTKRSAKYLGVTLDNKLTFWEHIRTTCDKAIKVTSSLGRLMANTGGPRAAIRRLLMSTVHSILLYGAEIWADAVKTHKYRSRLSSVQRMGALRIASSYRTVSESAVLVVAGVIPIDLLAQERKAIYNLSQEVGRKEAARRARETTMLEWQSRWENDSKGRWTASIIKNLWDWTQRDHGEVNFYLTQLLTGHGYFRSYLYNMGKVGFNNCIVCTDERDDAKHTFFVCKRFEDHRQSLKNMIGEISVESIVGKMLTLQANWNAVSGFVESVLRCKKEEGWLEP